MNQYDVRGGLEEKEGRDALFVSRGSSVPLEAVEAVNKLLADELDRQTLRE